MGFRFRKTKSYGPVRFTASKSGIGYSVGVKGARITKKAAGGIRTTTSIPGTGISYVNDLSYPTSRRKQKKAAKMEKKSLADTRRSIKKEYGLNNRQLKKLEKIARKHPQKYAYMTDDEIIQSVGGTPKEEPQENYKTEKSRHSFWWYLFMFMLALAVIRAIIEKISGR